MQVSKTPGVNTSQTSDAQVRNTAHTKPQTNTQIKTIDTQSVRSLSSLIASSGLPQDKLSASVLSLARFFSLSFKPEQLAAIRRHAFAHPSGVAQQQAGSQDMSAAQTASPPVAAKETSLTPNVRETLASEARVLSAAAAESKGAELQPKALDLLTEAVDPDSGRQNSNEQGKQDKEHKEQNESEKTAALNPDDIKKIALESAEENQIISILNKLPSKNGLRWIVLPFEFEQDKKRFRVSLRVLIEQESVVFTVVDIVIGGQGAGNREGSPLILSAETRQSFAIEFNNNKTSKINYYGSNISANNQKLIKKELASLFDISCENVFIKSEYSLPEKDYGGELLTFIDEAV